MSLAIVGWSAPSWEVGIGNSNLGSLRVFGFKEAYRPLVLDGAL